MTVRLYFPSTGTAPVSPAYGSSWTDTSLAARLPMTVTQRASSNSTITVSDADETNKSFLLRQYVSEPLRDGEIISGTFSLVMSCSETDTGNNMFLHAHLRLVDQNGNDYVSPKTIWNYVTDGTEFATSLTSRALSASSTSQTAADGDRLVLEIGVIGDPDAGKTHSCSVRIGDGNAADLAVSDADTDTDNPFITNTSITPEFWGMKWYLPSTTAAPTVSPSFDGGWEVTGSATRKKMVPVKTSTAMTSFTIDDADETSQDHLLVQYISPPLQNQIIPSGTTVRITARCSETNANNNIRLAGMVRVVDSDGNDYGSPKILFSDTSDPARDGTEVATSLTSRDHLLTTPGDVTIAEGDRLVFEVGLGGDPGAGGSHDSSLSLGDDSATDLGVSDNTSTDPNNPVIRFGSGTFHLSVSDYFEAVTYPQAVSATCTGTATNSTTQTFIQSVSATCTGTATNAPLTTYVQLVSATCTGTAVITDVTDFLRNITPTCTGTVTLKKSISLIRSTTATGSASIGGSGTELLEIAATCTGTATVSRVDKYDHDSEPFNNTHGAIIVHFRY